MSLNTQTAHHTQPNRLDDPTPQPGFRAFVSRHRGTFAFCTVVLLLLIAAAVWNLARAPHDGVLDPGNPKPEGARAVARVLEAEGVEVEIVRSAEDFADTRIDSDTTVLVTSDSERVPDLDQVVRRAAHAGDTLIPLLDPDDAEQAGLTLIEVVSGGTVDADCGDATLAGLRVETSTLVEYAGPGCFDNSVVTGPESVTGFGVSDILRNDRITAADNAAVALRLLGQHDRLVWYVPVPDPGSATDSAGSIGDFIPDWFGPSLLVAALAGGWFLLWSGRRFGPLVAESIPVEIPAIETTTSRGRLYHRTADRSHAAQILGQATRRRLALAARLAPDAPVDLVAAALSGQHGIDPARVVRVLAGTPINSDTDLAQWGRQLLELEAEVRSR